MAGIPHKTEDLLQEDVVQTPVPNCNEHSVLIRVASGDKNLQCFLFFVSFKCLWSVLRSNFS